MLIDDLKLLKAGETLDLGNGFQAFKTTYADIDINKFDGEDGDYRLAAWFVQGNVSRDKLRIIESFETDSDLRKIIEELLGNSDGTSGSEEAREEPEPSEVFGFQPAPDLTERKLGYLQGQVDVYERLISGGFTNLSK